MNWDDLPPRNNLSAHFLKSLLTKTYLKESAVLLFLRHQGRQQHVMSFASHCPEESVEKNDPVVKRGKKTTAAHNLTLCPFSTWHQHLLTWNTGIGLFILT